MSFKVIERGTNRKLVYELLLVVYSNFRCITRRFRDTSCFNAEKHILPTPLVFDLNLKVIPLECGDEIWRQKTRIMGLSYGEKNHDRRSNRAGRVHECDRRRDRFTMTKTALCITSRGKNCKWQGCRGLPYAQPVFSTVV